MSSDDSSQGSCIIIKEEICIEIDPEVIIEDIQCSGDPGAIETEACKDLKQDLSQSADTLPKSPAIQETERRGYLSGDEKRKRRKEQKRLNMQRARAKMSQQAIEKKRNDDRISYQRRKSEGLVKTIKDYTPEQQILMRKIWRARAITARLNKRNM